MNSTNKIYGITVKERKTFPIIAGMKFGTNQNKLKKVGTKIIEFTFDVNPNNSDDKMLISEKEISRKFYN